MRKLAVLALMGMFGFCIQASAQTPAQVPAKPKAAATPKAGTGAKTGTSAARPYDRALLRPAMLKEKAPETFQVKFTTTRGDFVVTVNRAWAPIGADRFYNLVKHHFYDNASFFRVVPGFVAQFGLSAYPPVTAAWEKATIKGEPVVQSNTKGFLTYAMGGSPDSRSTQVFINLKDNSYLDKKGFTPFGQVTEGIRVVEMLYDQYGDGGDMGGSGPVQGEIEKLGKPYLDKGWPKLDSIKATMLIVAAPEAAKPQ